jgi:hypothetical protein
MDIFLHFYLTFQNLREHYTLFPSP